MRTVLSRLGAFGGARLHLLTLVTPVLLLCVFARPSAALELQVGTWNVFDLPERFFPVGSAERMRQIPSALVRAAPLAQLDALVLTEAYVEADTQALLAELAAMGFAHRAALTRERWWDWARLPGVIVLSRWPLERNDSLVFRDACAGADCAALKGAVFATLRKQEGGRTHRVHVVGAHFYLGGAGHGHAARLAQARALRTFVQRQPVGSDEPVILGGDLNASWKGDGPDVQAALGAFSAQRTGALDFTFVGGVHPLGGSPWQRAQARCRHVRGDAAQLPGYERKWIDYVWAMAPGAQPARAEMRAVEVHGTTYRLARDTKGPCVTDVLSDHHLVIGKLSFLASTADERGAH